MALLELKFLGGLTLQQDGLLLPQVKSQKGQALLCYLAVSQQQATRPFLAALFWSNMPGSRALTNLRKVLSRLKPLTPYLIITRETITFNPDAGYWLDVAEFEQTTATSTMDVTSTLSTGVNHNIPHLQKAASLYKGDFLAGFMPRDAPLFEEWALAQRARLRELALRALHQLVTHFSEEGRYETPALSGVEAAAAYARQLLTIEPWHEETHRKLMRLLAHSGQRNAALAQYEICRQLLADELDVSPTTATVQLVEQIKAGTLPRKTVKRIWGELPGSRFFYGRQTDLSQLEKWLLPKQCKLVAILGMGGQGKTAVAIRLARTIAALSQNSGHQTGSPFDFIIWQSLINAPPLATVLQTITQIVAERPFAQTPTSAAQWQQLFASFRQKRCLIILDNVETILKSGDSPGQFRPGFADYGDLIEKFARQDHQSCLLLTSRERPMGFKELERNHGRVRSLVLSGLSSLAGQQLLADRRINSPEGVTTQLVERYSGNPLALHLIAEAIQEFFAGNITSFLTRQSPIFADIRDVLDQQFQRLSALERDILFWLAIERQPVAPETLWDNLIGGISKQAFLDALRALHRRSLLERVGTKATVGVALQNVVLEYVTDRLVETAVTEFNQIRPTDTTQLKLLNSHALLKAQAQDTIRESQNRLILKPLLQQLTAQHGATGVQEMLQRWLADLRQLQSQPPNYAAGNLLNLLIESGVEMNGLDFSQLTIWHAYLQDVDLPNVNFTGADMAGSVFTDTFAAVVSLAVSPDGAMIAAGTDDGEIRLWRMTDGQAIAIIQGHTDSVWSIAFSPDGRRFVTGSGDKTIRVWDSLTAQPLLTLSGHTSTVWAAIFTPDGQSLISGSLDRTVRIWDIATAQPTLTLTGHTNSIYDVAATSDGQMIASSSGDQTIRLWDAGTGQLRQILRGHTDLVGPIAFMPDGKILASASYDKTIRLWDVATGRMVHTFSGHTDRIASVAMSADGQTLASGSGDQTIRLWDVPTGEKRQVLVGHTNLVDCLAFTPDGETLLSGGYDQTVRLWDVGTGRPLHKLNGYNMSVTSVAFSPDGTTLASGSYDQKVRLWDLAADNGEKPFRRTVLEGHQNWVWAVAYSLDGTILASASYDNTVRLWDVGTGQLRHVLRGHEAWVVSVVFCPDGQTVATGSLDRTIRLWDMETGNPVQEPIHCSDLIWSIDVSADGQLIACGGYGSAITLWHIGSGQVQQTLSGHTSFVWSVVFSPDSQLLASGSFDSTVRLWNVATGETIGTLQGHKNWVECVAFAPNGRVLASGSHDQTIHLWDVKTNQLLHILQGHTKMVSSVAFSPDGQTLASSSGDKTIKLWDVPTGVCRHTLQAKLPYAGMNITGVSSLTPSQKFALKALGAIEGRETTNELEAHKE